MNKYLSNLCNWKMIKHIYIERYSARDSSEKQPIPLGLGLVAYSPTPRLQIIYPRTWHLNGVAPKVKKYVTPFLGLVYFIFTSAFLLPTFGYAQTKNFTISEAITGMSGKFAVKNLKQLQWMGSSDYYAYVQEDSVKQIVKVNASSFQWSEWITLQHVNTILAKQNIKALTNFPALNYLSANECYFQHDQKIILLNANRLEDIQMEVIAELPKDASEVMVDTNKMSVAFVSEDNLMVSYRNAKPIKITKDGSKNLVYGQSVHRNEFGIDKGIFWSTNGNFIAFYKMDQSMVEDYPIIDWSKTPAVANNIKYPFAGRTSHQVSLGIFDCKTAKTIYLQIDGPKEQYLTAVSWSPDERYIYVTVLNRDQNHAVMQRYDITGGHAVKKVLEEKNEKYVEPQHPLYFVENNPNEFLRWSQQDGYMHLYHYKNEELVGQLTKGKWIVNELLGYNKTKNEILFMASEASPMQKNLYAVNLSTKEIRRVSTTLATHTCKLSASGNYVLDSYAGHNYPRNIEVLNIVNGSEKRILTAPNTLTEFQLAKVEDIKLKASDDTELIGKLIYPTNFDANKRYPVIVYLYNGPHVQLNKDMFPYSGNLWYDYMAQKGYFVFVLDGRGSSNRGFAFESVTFRQLGTIELEDQLRGVAYLKSLPFIDANRMGIHGWSFGGFMTTSMMLKHPEVFVCGVAGGPVMDWSMYEVMYTERFMDTPDQNKEGYQNSLLLDKVKNLQGKLLLIHGTEDDVVLWQHSIQFVKKAVDEGKQVDYFVYPGHPHNVRGKDRVHLMQKVSDYFDLYLK
jgi:dipeptidyl-peptidase-4